MHDRFDYFPPEIKSVYIRTRNGDTLKIENPITANLRLELGTDNYVRGRLEIEYDTRYAKKMMLTEPDISDDEFEKLLLE